MGFRSGLKLVVMVNLGSFFKSFWEQKSMTKVSTIGWIWGDSRGDLDLRGYGLGRGKCSFSGPITTYKQVAGRFES